MCRLPDPDKWDLDFDPPYAMFAYYMYANLQSLNKLRYAKGLSTFAFRPHAGEAGNDANMCSCMCDVYVCALM